MSLLSGVHKFLPNIVLYNVTAYVEKKLEIISLDFDVSITMDHILCTGQIVEGEL